jgi:hypothetical protein
VYDGGAPVTGRVDARGGSVSRLYFAVVGDARPAAQDDTEGYPSDVVSRIFQTMQATLPPPTFALSTGDYQFASPSGSQAGAQIDRYLAARQRFAGTLFPAMGNHECTGATDSNCGAGNRDGVTSNYSAFMSKLLAPIGRAKPWFEIDVNSLDGTWSSKFLFLAANAWSAEQAAWLDRAMARVTTYTFVVRHEGSSARSAPGVSPSEAIMSRHPFTLLICGHTHTYDHPTSREIIVGNGGAPLSSARKGYGFATLSQQVDGSIAVDMIDYVSGQVDPGFHFVAAP